MDIDVKRSSYFGFLDSTAQEVAPRLLGCVLEYSLDDEILACKIVETEAYDQQDQASHSYNGKTPRTEVMFGPSGFLYVYFTYGMHYCCNVTVGPAGHGAAVLIRALEPIRGVATMKQRRHKDNLHELTNGPAKLCQAMGIDKALNGHDLFVRPLKMIVNEPLPSKNIVQTTRVGISKAKEQPWRYYIRDNEYVSYPR